jgi:hypothetical protein
MNYSTKRLCILIIFISSNSFSLFSQVNWNQVNFNGSGDCNRDQNANRDDRAPALKDRIRAVSEMVVGGGRCTGMLINQNVSDNEIKQYYITAYHCVDGKNLNDSVAFYFNYQSPDGNSESMPQTPVDFRIGQGYKHNSLVSVIDYDTYTDVVLLKIEKPIPANYNIYYMIKTFYETSMIVAKYRST